MWLWLIFISVGCYFLLLESYHQIILENEFVILHDRWKDLLVSGGVELFSWLFAFAFYPIDYGINKAEIRTLSFLCETNDQMENIPNKDYWDYGCWRWGIRMVYPLMNGYNTSAVWVCPSYSQKVETAFGGTHNQRNWIKHHSNDC